MKLFLVSIPVLAVFISCQSASEKEKKEEPGIEKAVENSSEIMTNPKKIAVADIPAELKITGKAQEVWKWTDKTGENILVTSVVEPYDDTEKNEYDEEGQTAELHAALFVKKDDRYQNTWMLNDKEKACPFDITCSFIPNSTTITDLDKNGFAEIKVQYLLACRSDVSPAAMKIMMWENNNSYDLTGFSWLETEPDAKFDVTAENVNLEKLPQIKNEMNEWLRTFGRYKSEKNFATAPAEFLTYARNEWLKYAKEKIGE
ncbi:MAG TPA: hypothetical protein PKC72_03545 [Chitinophagaceae bacterium]|nr:hypothetical protein [Chitinophagaceae bacterium]